MDLHVLRIYLDVLETGSLAAAGRKHHITQPAVSMAMASLEKHLGHKLLIRTSGQRVRISPTREGIIFRNFALDVINSYKKMQIQMLQGEEFEPFAIATSPTPGAVVLPILLNEFKADYPQITCKIRTYFGDEMIHKLKSHEFDMAISGIHINDPEIATERFFFDPMELICPISMKVTNNITLHHLQKLPLIIRNRECNTTKLIESNLQRLGLTFSNMNIIMQVDGNIDVLQAVSLGVGVGFVTKSLLSIDTYDKIRVIKVNKLKVNRFLHLVRLKANIFSPSIKLFWEYAKDAQWRKGHFAYNTQINLI